MIQKNADQNGVMNVSLKKKANAPFIINFGDSGRLYCRFLLI